jgi:AraC family transcriptional activator of pobA
MHTLDQFYTQAEQFMGRERRSLEPPDMDRATGHFNIFDIADTLQEYKRSNCMSYDRRTYYKISLIKGRNRAEYADKTIDIRENAILFATPRVPYHWVPMDDNQAGLFCIFTRNFVAGQLNGHSLDELPIFRAGSLPVFEIGETDVAAVEAILRKMQAELHSSYTYKYDLLRHYLAELIHYGQKLQPATAPPAGQSAAGRIAALFMELLERQFPGGPAAPQPALRSAKDYADRLAVHVNHLNKVLKEQAGKTTTQLIHDRVLQEAKVLLKHSAWNISEVAYQLGFEETAHFSNFFKKHTHITPQEFRV